MTERETRPRSDASLLKASNRPSNMKKLSKSSELSASEVASKAKKIGKQLMGMKSLKKKDDFIEAIRTLAQLLQRSSQRSAEVKRATADVVKALGSNDLVKHKDKEVKLYVAICSFHVLRLHAPDTPFSDDTLTSVFHLFMLVMKNLGDMRSQYFQPTLDLLGMTAKIKCCLLMLDLDQADGLLVDLCSTIFQCLTSQEIFDAIHEPALDVLGTLIDESDVISQALLDCILGSLAPSSLGMDADDVADVAQVFAQKLLRRSRESLQPHVQKFLTQILDGVRTTTDLVGNPSQLVLRVYEASPQIMLPVMPHLEPSLRVEGTDRRLEGVDLICKLLSSNDKTDVSAVKHLSCEYPQLLDGVLGRLNDKEPAVRMKVLQHARDLIANLPMAEQKNLVIQESLSRLKDGDEKVRIAATISCCSIAADFSDAVLDDALYKALTVRLWDRKLSVRKEAASGFVKIIRAWCLECQDVQTFPKRKKVVEFVAGICSLTQLADPELASFIEDEVLRQGIFPMKKLSPAMVCDWWSAVWAESADQAKKPIIALLKHKCSLQEHVASMLQLRLDIKSERKTRTSVHGLAHIGAANKSGATESAQDQTLSDRLSQKIGRVAALMKHIPKAHESLEKIFGMKDNNLFKNLASLATLGTSFTSASGAAKDLLTRLGSKGPTSDLAQALSARMCPSVIPPEILTIALKNASEDRKMYQFVVELSNAEPRLFVGALPALTKLLTSDDELETNLAAEVVGNAGKYIFSSEKILLEDNALHKLVQLCACGRHRNSKHAARALMHATRYLDDRKDIIDTVCNSSWNALREDGVTDDHSILLSHVKVLSVVMRMSMDTMNLYCSRFHGLVIGKLLPKDLSKGKPLSNRYDSLRDPAWSQPSPDVEIKAELIKAMSQSIVPVLCTGELAPSVSSLAKRFCEELQDLTDMDTSAPQFEGFRWKLNHVNWSGKSTDPSSNHVYDPSQYSEEEKLALEKQIADTSPDAGWIRLSAAKAMFRLFRIYDGVLNGSDYLGLGLACQDSMVEVRQDLLDKIDTTVSYFQNLGPGGAKQRSAKMAALYALYGADPYEPNMKKAFGSLRRYICKRRSILQKMSVARATTGDSGTMVNAMPEFILTFLVYFMAHHPDYDAEAMSLVEAGDELMALFKDSLQIALEALMLPQSTNQKDKESLAALLKNNAGVSLKILRQLKYSDVVELESDSTDYDASRNAHQICDIGLSLTRRILHEFSPISGTSPSGFSGPIHLPKRFWQPKRVTEEDKRLDGSDLPPQLKGPQLRGLFSESCGIRLKFRKPRGKKRLGNGGGQVVEQAKKKKVDQKVAIKEDMEVHNGDSIEELFSDDDKTLGS